MSLCKTDESHYYRVHFVLNKSSNTGSEPCFTEDTQSISDGNKFSQAVQVANKSTQLLAVGVNCSPPDLVKPLLESAKSHKAPNMSWVVYPNSGEDWEPSKGWKTDKRMPFSDLSLEWKEQGALWIGGCCRVGPADIMELRSVLI
ncbi:uncharacterized protein [Hoplias malabaricus]|uniref:uncharacterized protein n=1 Tax=Hoplias malabaricus TaxID=27720 RepID=UPI00346319B1